MEERQANTEKAISEHTRMGLDLRRELFSKFSSVETVVEEKVKSIDGPIEEMRLHLAAAEARLPADGALVNQGFSNFENEIGLFKKGFIEIEKRQALEASTGATLTVPMLEEVELMRQRTVAHEQSINMLSGSFAHLQVLLDSLGSATSVQSGRVAGLEQHTAQLQGYMESLRAF